MDVTLSAKIEAKIRQKAESGLYHSTEEVIDEALRLLDEHERLQSLRAKIAEGNESEAIPFTPEMRAESSERAKRRARAGERPSPDVRLDGMV